MPMKRSRYSAPTQNSLRVRIIYKRTILVQAHTKRMFCHTCFASHNNGPGLKLVHADITENNNEDQIWLVKIVEYIGFYVDRRC